MDSANTSKPPRLFWIALVAPAGLSLTVVAVNAAGIRGNSVAGIALFPMLGACLFGASYCGAWLGRHFGKSTLQKELIALIFIVGLLAVDLVISMAGCAQNISFH